MRTFVFAIAASLCAFGADYTGNQACAPCHGEIVRSYLRTPMAQSSGRVGADEAERFKGAEFRDARGAYAYTVGREGSSYYFEFRQQAARQPILGRRELEYFVGSGHAARGYLINVDGFLYEAPVAFYATSGSWNAAPGFAPRSEPYLNRAILPGCLECHSSFVQWKPGTQNAYSSPPFRENGVACERCHGPGSEHIATGKPMINPAKLAARERDSICEQCHLSGDIRVPKQGKDDLSFQPGARTEDVMTVFVRSGTGTQMKVTSHVEDLAQSACKRASGAKLWCGTCHDPHTVPAATEKVAYFRAKCLSCHQTSDCRASQTARRAAGDDCVSCHMSRHLTTDVDHVVFTDHSIRRRKAEAPSPAPDAALVVFGGGSAGPRDLGLAYALVGRREQVPAYLDRAFALLQEAAARGSADALAVANLAEFYRNRKDDAHALPLYEQAWRMDPGQAPVAAALGAYQMQRGNLGQAIQLWNQALAIDPSMVLVRANLATALQRAGRPDEAKEMMRKVLEFNPAFAPAREFLDGSAK